jgi:parallel beta-helix repeat protein
MKTHLGHPALALACAVILPPSSFLLAQGSLTPPGAPAATMKSLDQIEPRTPISALPFTITTRGSYYVTGNLAGIAGQHGITIDADHVTLDLGGFALAGPGSGAATNGIRVINARTNATIRNGSVHGWGGTGIAVAASASIDLRVEKVRATANGAGGILLGSRGTAWQCEASGNLGTGIAGTLTCKVIECTTTGNTGANSRGIHVGADALVRDCLAMDNGSSGIQAGNACILTGCVAENNGAIGFLALDGSTVRDCTARSNVSTGFSGFGRSTLTNCTAMSNGSSGFIILAGATLAHCSSASNTTSGFSLANSTTLDHCSATFNTSNGFIATDANTLRGCSAHANGSTGIVVGAGAVLTSCTVVGNEGIWGINTGIGATIVGCSVRGAAPLDSTIAIMSGGIFADNDSLISQCVVSDIASNATTLTASTGIGINASSNCTIERNTVQGCRGDGIRAIASCLILANTCDGNGLGTGDGAGIHTTSDENRIEGNSVTANERGIDVDAAGNLIIKNSAATNATDYDIAASNRYGAIVNITAAGAAAVTGNSAASTLTSTDPWANFSY